MAPRSSTSLPVSSQTRSKVGKDAKADQKPRKPRKPRRKLKAEPKLKSTPPPWWTSTGRVRKHKTPSKSKSKEGQSQDDVGDQLRVKKRANSKGRTSLVRLNDDDGLEGVAASPSELLAVPRNGGVNLDRTLADIDDEGFKDGLYDAAPRSGRIREHGYRHEQIEQAKRGLEEAVQKHEQVVRDIAAARRNGRSKDVQPDLHFKIENESSQEEPQRRSGAGGWRRLEVTQRVVRRRVPGSVVAEGEAVPMFVERIETVTVPWRKMGTVEMDYGRR